MEAALPLFAVVLKKVVWESIGLTDARTGGRRRASWTNDAQGKEIPEMELNLTLLTEAFLQLLASGLGTLALVWATVVLLGGFSTMLVRTDFWFTTAIVFIETARIVGYNSGPEARFFVDVLSDFSQNDIKRVGSLTDLVRILSKVPAVIPLAPIFAAAGCITLSIMRILPIARHGKYGDSSADSSNGNIKPALLLFYVLVLTQGSLFILWFAVAINRSSLTEKLRRQYFGSIIEGRKLIKRYVAVTVDKCIEKGVVSTMNRTLVSFAAELLQSEDSADHVCAVSVLHAVITRKERTSGAVQQFCGSKESVGKLFEILSSEEIVFNQDISIYEQQSIDNRNVGRLIVHGLVILAKLAKRPKCAEEIYKNKGLFSRIIAPISNELYKWLIHDEIAIEITGKSLLVLNKLVRGTDVCQEICKIGLGPNTIHQILLTDDKDNKLKVPAINMLTKLILTAPSKDYNTIADFISVLMKLFFTDANGRILRKSAGKALALLSREDSKIFCEMVVNGNTGTDDSVVQKLTKMLSDSRNKLDKAIGKLLMQFCTNLPSEEARQHLEAVKTTILREVLKIICYMEPKTRYKRRKTLVALLDLAVQMCECDELLDADDFDVAVKQILIFRSNEAEIVVGKLKEIIEMCNKESVALLRGKGPCADYLALIKSVTKLCAWVMRTKPDYRVYFQEKNLAWKLKDALEAMGGLEMTVLLSYRADNLASYETLASSYRADNLASYETLASIVEDARRLIYPTVV